MAIYIPDKIKVGYCKRKDTYTGKLAYVIYYDERGKLRKETSWQNWRDKNISPDDFENVPTEGFVLNRKAGGVEEQWGWNARKTYCRVYDPRGFEFEIDIVNLLFVLEYCDSIKGKGLVGKFVYGWDEKDLVLLPVDCPDYKKHKELSKMVNSNNKVKAKDLKIGATYIDKNNKEYIYMGKFDYWDNCGYETDGKVFSSWNKMIDYCNENNIYLERAYGRYRPIKYKQFVTYVVGKKFWFWSNDMFYQYTNITNKFIACINENCVSNYAELYDDMEHYSNFSPIDEDRVEYCYYTYNEFLDKANRCSFKFITKIKGIMNDYWAYKDRSYSNIIRLNISDTEEVLKHNKHLNSFIIDRELTMSVDKFFEEFKPMYKQTYLKNGNKYRKVGCL